MSPGGLVPVFDLDGTLLDSDEALALAFVAFGIPREDVRFGEPVRDACDRLGVPLQAYVDAYDPARSKVFGGVVELLAALDRWAVCSNKHPDSGFADLDRWGWRPEVVLFSDAFGWGEKRLAPVLEDLGLGPDDIVYIGDSPHDQHVAAEAGVTFVVAAWNPRAVDLGGDVVLRSPLDLLGVLGR